jgi:hypothetical protein
MIDEGRNGLDHANVYSSDQRHPQSVGNGAALLARFASAEARSD